MSSKVGVPRPTPPSPTLVHHWWSPSCRQTSSPSSSEVHVNLFVFAAKNFLRVAPILSWRLLVCCNLFQTSSFPQGSCWQSQKKVKLRQWISLQTLHCRHWASLRSPFCKTSTWKQQKLKNILTTWNFSSFAFGPRFYTSSWAKAAL